MDQQILTSIIQIASCTSLLSAALLWMRRNGNRSRVYFSLAYGVCGIDLILRIFDLYSDTPLVFKALQPAAIYMSLIEIPLFLFYLIEVVNPGWLTWRKALGLCAPWLLCNMCFFTPGLHFRELDTLSDIFRHIGEANVWLRLLFALLIPPYSILIYSIPYNWRRSSADQNLIRLYISAFIVLALFFVSSSVSGLITVSSLHLSYGTLFCFGFAYYELFVRLQVPKEEMVPANDRIPDLTPTEMCCVTTCASDEEYQSEKKPELVEQAASEEQWRKINREIENKQPWRNPDLSIVALADLLHTNRSTLSHLFHEHGYGGGYKEFINRHRIADFLELMDKHPHMNLQDAFFEAGYRSRMTALRNFKEYMGMGPSEYLSHKTKEK